jgi:hypothetical protein
MQKFLVLYQSTVPASEQMKNATPAQAKAGMDAWMAWAGQAQRSNCRGRREFAGRRLLDSPGRIEGCADGPPEEPSARHGAGRLD